MARALEILAAALLLALAAVLALLAPGIRIAPYDLPGELSVLEWPREMAALICVFLGLRAGFGSWAGCPELRPALVSVIVLAQVPVWCAAQLVVLRVILNIFLDAQEWLPTLI